MDGKSAIPISILNILEKSMPDWEKIFTEKGYVFIDPHPDMSRLVEIFHDRGVKRILDIGCGTGRNLVYLSQAGFDVSGLDSSKTAIELTRQWLDEENLDAHLHHGRMEETLPYDDDLFDAIISVQVIHHNLMTQILATIQEIDRVLRTGGYLYITVPILGPEPKNPENDWKLNWIEDGTYIPQCGPESGIPHHYFSEEELQRVLFDYEILEMYIDNTDHRCVHAIKKS